MDPVQLDKERLETASRDDQELINSLFILFKTAQYVEANNATYLTQSAKFYVIFRRLVDEGGRISIKMLDGRVFICDKLVKFDSDGMVRARQIMDHWHQLGIGGMILNDTLDNRQIDKFVHLLVKLKVNDANREAIGRRLADLGIDGITLLAAEEKKHRSVLSGEHRAVLRRAARATFFRAIALVEDVMVQTAQEKEVDFGRAKRVVHTLIDLIAEDEAVLLELTSIRDFDQYTYAHCTNVCVYSLTMGVKLGLERQQLSELGFAALFHDIGKVRLPGDLIRKPDAFDENDWIQMQKHPVLGAKTILRNLKLDRHAARAAIAALEHHINADYTGYPSLRQRRPINLFSKIISIADTFDALSSGRVYIKKKISPDEVLRKMMYQMTIKFDAFLLRLFVNIIGIFPPGTLVLLVTDELGLVVRNNPLSLSAPIVKIIGDRNGPYTEFPEVDLSAPENRHRRVARIIDPTKYQIDLKNIILS